MEQSKSKRLYRSHKNKVVGGVLGGIGEYLGIEPLILRAIYVLLIIFAVSVYLVLPFLAQAPMISSVILVLVALYLLLWAMLPSRKQQETSG